MKTIAYQKLAEILVTFLVDVTPIWNRTSLRSMRAAFTPIVDSGRDGAASHPAIGGGQKLAL